MAMREVTLTRTDILMDRIDEVRANSVTPEKFEKTWGCSLEEHVDDMMDFIHDLESKDSDDRIVKEATKKELLQFVAIPAAIPAAAAKEKTAIKLKDIQKEIRKSLFKDIKNLVEKIPAAAAKEKTAIKLKDIQKEIRKSLFKDIKNLVEKILTENNQNIEFINVEGIGGKENIGKIKLKKRMLSYKKDPISWKLKLVAVKEESEKSISTGTPMVLRNLSYPDDDMSIVARKLSLKKKMLYVTPITKSSGDVRTKVLDQIKLTKGVNILSVDVGRLDIGNGKGRNTLTPGTFKSGKQN